MPAIERFSHDSQLICSLNENKGASIQVIYYFCRAIKEVRGDCGVSFYLFQMVFIIYFSYMKMIKGHIKNILVSITRKFEK